MKATLIFLLMHFVVIGATLSSCAGQALRIATLNLHWDNRRIDQALVAVAAANADIVCFQETTKESERVLRDRLSNTHPHFCAIGHQGRYMEERFAIVSRLPLRATEFHPPEAGLFGFYEAAFDVGNEPVNLVNVHLSPFIIPRGAGLMGTMAAIKEVENKHLDEAKAICAAIDVSEPTIIVGDFNSLATLAAPQHLAQKGFIDSFAAVHEKADAHPTWRFPTRPVPMRLRIDHIFHSPHFVSLESEIINNTGSDHSLVVSELKLVEMNAVEVPP